MPSAARQRLPAELWKNPESSIKSPVPSYISHEIQAHPGYSETIYNEKAPVLGKPVLQQIFKRQLAPTNKKKKRNLQRRGSSEDLLKDQGDLSHSTQASASVCSDSECGVSYNSSDCGDFFAADSVKAPAVNALPLPPPGWLKSFSKRDGKPGATNKASFQFQAFFGTLVAAERHV